MDKTLQTKWKQIVESVDSCEIYKADLQTLNEYEAIIIRLPRGVDDYNALVDRTLALVKSRQSEIHSKEQTQRSNRIAKVSVVCAIVSALACVVQLSFSVLK